MILREKTERDVTVLSNNTYQTSTVLEIDTDLNLINSTVQTQQKTRK